MIEPRNELLDVPMTQDRAKMQIRKKGNGARLGNRWRHEGYVPINGMIRLPCSFTDGEEDYAAEGRTQGRRERIPSRDIAC